MKLLSYDIFGIKRRRLFQTSNRLYFLNENKFEFQTQYFKRICGLKFRKILVHVIRKRFYRLYRYTQQQNTSGGIFKFEK